MKIKNLWKCHALLLLSNLLFASLAVRAQVTPVFSTKAPLPPLTEWKGKSESLCANADNPWITACEKSNFVTTPTYAETMVWCKKLADASPLISMVEIGKSVEGRAIILLIASSETDVSAAALAHSTKPLLFVQAGIHAGEIDGKDAGMMLLRDIAFGNKKYLLDQVNFIFIPILNVDGHERMSAYNRPNQRGPENMGYRTNAQNLNLNRDYAKLDTKEIRAVVKVINDYQPLLYMDIHVTDGADYQYDITYGGAGKQGYSPAINNWLEISFTPAADADLKAMGHVPGPFINGLNWNDPSGGIVDILNGPNFSNTYGDLRHVATLLVENHSLKPYKQRVLGTYVLLESALKILATKGVSLRECTVKDKAIRKEKIAVEWKVPQMKNTVSFETLGNLQSSTEAVQAPDSFLLMGIQAETKKSEITGADYPVWTGIKKTSKVASYKGTEEVQWIVSPKGYWIPAAWTEVIERLKLHGIKMEILTEEKEVNVHLYRIKNAKFGNAEGVPLPFEGRMQVNGIAVPEMHKIRMAVGSVYISTDQPLGELAMVLLEPNSPNSFFRWGFFAPIFQRTEYIEAYVMEPLIKKMLDESPELKQEFEAKKMADKSFAQDPEAMYEWFYSKTKYYDERYLLYPVGREN